MRKEVLASGVRRPVRARLAARDTRLHRRQAPFLDIGVMAGITCSSRKETQSSNLSFPCSSSVIRPTVTLGNWKCRFGDRRGPVKTQLGSFQLEIQPLGAPVPSSMKQAE